MKKRVIAFVLLLSFVFIQVDVSMIEVNAASNTYANDDIETFEKIEELNSRLITIVDSTSSKDELLRLHVKLIDESYSLTKELKNTNVKGIVKDSVTNIYYIQFDTKEDVEKALSILDGKKWVDFVEKNEEIEIPDEYNFDEEDFLETISNIQGDIKSNGKNNSNKKISITEDDSEKSQVVSASTLKAGDTICISAREYTVLDPNKTSMGTEGVFVVAKCGLYEFKNIQMNNSSTTYEKDGFKYRDKECTNLYNDYQGSYMQQKMVEYYERELMPRYKEYIIPTTKQDSAYVVNAQDAVSSGTVATYTKDESNANYKGASLNNDYIFPMSVEEVITYYSSLEARKVTIFHESGEVLSALRSPLIRDNQTALGERVCIVNKLGKIGYNNASPTKADSSMTYSIKPAMNLNLKNAKLFKTAQNGVYRLAKYTGSPYRSDYEYLSWGIKAHGIDKLSQDMVDQGYSGQVTYAIADSGVNLYNSLWSEHVIDFYNVTKGNSDFSEPYSYHGPHCTTNSFEGMYNLLQSDNFSINIIALQVFPSTTASTYITSLRYACENGADVINLSVSYSNSDAIRAAAAEVTKNGLVMCSAAVNSAYVDVPSWPAVDPADGNVTVGAARHDGDDVYVDLTYSSSGKTVDIVASGTGMTGISDIGDEPHSGSGTSYATPTVAGVMCLLKLMHPDYTAEELEKFLRSNCTRDMGPVGYDKYYGYGLLDVKNLLDNHNTEKTIVKASPSELKKRDSIIVGGNAYKILDPKKTNMGTNGTFVISNNVITDNILFNTEEHTNFKRNSDGSYISDYTGSNLERIIDNYYDKELKNKYSEYIITTNKDDSVYSIPSGNRVDSAYDYAAFSSKDPKVSSLKNKKVFAPSAEEIITYINYAGDRGRGGLVTTENQALVYRARYYTRSPANALIDGNLGGRVWVLHNKLNENNTADAKGGKFEAADPSTASDIGIRICMNLDLSNANLYRIGDNSFILMPNDFNENNSLFNKKALFVGDDFMYGTEDWAHERIGISGRALEKVGLNVDNKSYAFATVSNNNPVLRIPSQIVSAAGKDYEIVLVGAGLRDALNKVDTGDISQSYNKEDFDENTFAGGLEASLYEAIKLYGKKSKIGVFISTKSGIDSVNIKLNQYTNVAKDICRKWDVPFLDLYNNSELNNILDFTTNSSNNKNMTEYSINGRLPNYNAYQAIFPYINNFILSLNKYQTSNSNINQLIDTNGIKKMRELKAYDVIRIKGIDWLVLNPNKTNDGRNGIFAVMKNDLTRAKHENIKSFYNNTSGSTNNNYITSNIRSFLNEYYNKNLKDDYDSISLEVDEKIDEIYEYDGQRSSVKIISKSNTENVKALEGDRLFLMSLEEYDKYLNKSEYSVYYPPNNEKIALRSPSYNSSSSAGNIVYYMNTSATENLYSGSVQDKYYLRPAINLNIPKKDYKMKLIGNSLDHNIFELVDNTDVGHAAYFKDFDGEIIDDLTVVDLDGPEELVMPMPQKKDGYTFVGWIGDKSKIDRENVTFQSVYVKTAYKYKDKNTVINLETNYKDSSKLVMKYKKKDSPNSEYISGFPKDAGEYIIAVNNIEGENFEPYSYSLPKNIKKGSSITYKANNGVTITNGTKINIAGFLYDVVDPSKTNTGDTNGMFLMARKLTSYGMPPIVEQGETYDKTGTRPDGRLANDYQGSNLQKVIRNDFESNYKDKYGKYILPTSKVDSVFTSTKSKSYGSNAFVYHMNTNPDVGATLDGDYIFAPSAEEVNEYLTYDSNSLITKSAQNDSSVNNYWYRSPYVGTSSGEKTFGYTNVNKFHWQTSPQGQYSRRTLLCMNVNLDEAYLEETAANTYTLLTEEDEKYYNSTADGILLSIEKADIEYTITDNIEKAYDGVEESIIVNVNNMSSDEYEVIISNDENSEISGNSSLTNAGILDVYVRIRPIGDAANYYYSVGYGEGDSPDPIHRTIKISKAEMPWRISDSIIREYNGKEALINVSVDGFTSDMYEVIKAGSNESIANAETTSLTNVGTITLYIKIRPIGTVANNYYSVGLGEGKTTSAVQRVITINPARITATINDAVGAENGTNYGISVSNIVTQSSQEAHIKYSTENSKTRPSDSTFTLDEPTKYSAKGEYTTWVRITADNHETFYAKGTVVIADSVSTVKFLDKDGKEIEGSFQYVDTVERIKYPIIPAYENYRFVGWLGDTSKVVEEDITLQAIYVKNTYTKSYDKTTISLETNYSDASKLITKYRKVGDTEYTEGLPTLAGEYEIRVTGIEGEVLTPFETEEEESKVKKGSEITFKKSSTPNSSVGGYDGDRIIIGDATYQVMLNKTNMDNSTKGMFLLDDSLTKYTLVPPSGNGNNIYQGSTFQAKLIEDYEQNYKPNYGRYILPTTRTDAGYQNPNAIGVGSKYYTYRIASGKIGSELINDYIFPPSAKEIYDYARWGDGSTWRVYSYDGSGGKNYWLRSSAYNGSNYTFGCVDDNKMGRGQSPFTTAKYTRRAMNIDVDNAYLRYEGERQYDSITGVKTYTLMSEEYQDNKDNIGESIKASINKLDVTYNVAGNIEKEYDGKEAKIAVTVDGLTEGIDYEVIYSSSEASEEMAEVTSLTNVGELELYVRIKPLGEYANMYNSVGFGEGDSPDPIHRTIKINKANITATVKNDGGPYTGEGYCISVTDVVTKGNQEAHLYYSTIDSETRPDDSTFTLESAPIYEEAGSYNTWVKITADNHNSFYGKGTVIINNNPHKVTFLDIDGNEITGTSQEVLSANEIVYPNAAEVEGYKFLGWSGKESQIAVEDVTFKATYVKDLDTKYVVGDNIEVSIKPEDADINLTYSVINTAKAGEVSDKLPTLPGSYTVTIKPEEKTSQSNIKLQAGTKASNPKFVSGVEYSFDITHKKVTWLGGFNNETVIEEQNYVALPNSLSKAPSATPVTGYTFLGYLGDISRAIEEEVEMKAIYVKSSVSKVYDGEAVIISTNYDKELTYNENLPLEVGEYVIGVSVDDTGFWAQDIEVTVNIVDKLYTIRFLDKDGNELGDFAQEVRYKADIVLPKAEDVPEVEGYKFIGWYGYEELADELESDVLLQTMYIKLPDVQSIGKDMEDLDINIPDAEIVYTYYDLEGNVLDAPPSIPGTYRVEATIMLNGKELTKTSFDVEFKNTQIPNIPIYRLYNPVSGEHLFTSKVGEYNKLPKSGWVQEGMTFDAYAEDNKPEDAIEVYRLFNPKGFKGKGDHHYTKSEGEIKKLVKAGWSLDFDGKPAFYVAGKISVYKLYDKRTGAHHYTPKLGERKNMEKAGWVYEGEAWTVNGYYSNNGTQRISDENM